MMGRFEKKIILYDSFFHLRFELLKNLLPCYYDFSIPPMPLLFFSKHTLGGFLVLGENTRSE